MINERFEANQKDLTLSDVKVQWLASCVRLYLPEHCGKDLAVITVDTRTVAKIKAWCVKNSYRCSQIRGDLIYL